MKLPLIGLGTYKLKDKKCSEVVEIALDIGYRHIDTAFYYDNHAAIGKAIQDFERRKLFITSKVASKQIDPANVKDSIQSACESALEELNTPYLDLYLLHAPDRNKPMRQILETLAKLKEQGLVREIGVSNFTINHLKDALSWNIPIKVNQVEFHPYLNQVELLSFCEEQNIQLMSFRSLGKGNLSEDPKLQKIAKTHGKTVSQVILRWLTEKNIPVIPKASSRKHLEENFNILDFSLADEERAILENMNENRRYVTGDWTDFEY